MLRYWGKSFYVATGALKLEIGSRFDATVSEVPLLDDRGRTRSGPDCKSIVTVGRTELITGMTPRRGPTSTRNNTTSIN